MLQTGTRRAIWNDFRGLRPGTSYQRRPRYCGDEGISLTQELRNSATGGRTSADCSWNSSRNRALRTLTSCGSGSASAGAEDLEDQVHDVLGVVGLRRDRLDDGDQALDADAQAELLLELAAQRFGQRLAELYAAAGEEPVTLVASPLLYHQDTALVNEQPCDANSRLLVRARLVVHAGHGHLSPVPLEPKPRSPRCVASRPSDRTSLTSVSGRNSSCAMRSPGATVKVASVSVFRRMMRTSPR